MAADSCSKCHKVEEEEEELKESVLYKCGSSRQLCRACLFSSIRKKQYKVMLKRRQRIMPEVLVVSSSLEYIELFRLLNHDDDIYCLNNRFTIADTIVENETFSYIQLLREACIRAQELKIQNVIFLRDQEAIASDLLSQLFSFGGSNCVIEAKEISRRFIDHFEIEIIQPFANISQLEIDFLLKKRPSSPKASPSRSSSSHIKELVDSYLANLPQSSSAFSHIRRIAENFKEDDLSCSICNFCFMPIRDKRNWLSPFSSNDKSSSYCVRCESLTD